MDSKRKTNRKFHCPYLTKDMNCPYLNEDGTCLLNENERKNKCPLEILSADDDEWFYRIKSRILKLEESKR